MACPLRNVELRYLGGDVEPNIPVTDMLHRKTIETNRTHCPFVQCKGSMLSREARLPLTAEEKEAQVYEFYKNYYNDTANSRPSISKEDRLKEVFEAINATGTYEHTEDELGWAARTAWRNSARCVGRSMWKTLAVKDERHLKTPRQIFNKIVEHFRFTHNGGNIIPTAVVFDQRRSDKRPGIRIWNRLILSFAGHTQENGEIVGDPSNVFLTDLAKEMGWKPKATAFELLPLIITDANENTEWFELPEDLKGYLIDIKHSSIPAISELGIKWYAIPSVSFMLLEAGGIHYTGIPVAGFYQDTEVSIMDLLATSRYNLLETVGRAMNLDVNVNTSYWKSVVGLEFTRAVYESYKNAGVTMVDHFTISERFQSFMKEELELRGGCPADWVWIVPPLSSGVVPTFHQEMLRYTLHPSYEYQIEAEDYFVKPRKKLTFRGVAWIVYFFVMKAVQKFRQRKMMSIVYATETGTSREFAKSSVELFEYGFNVNLMSMDEVDQNEGEFYQKIKDSVFTIFIVSTFGVGESPLMATTFANQIKELENYKGVKWFEDLKYGVFGLGSSDYPNLAAFGKTIHNRLKDIGAEPLIDMGIGDDQKDQVDAYEQWINKIYQVSCGKFLPSAADGTGSSLNTLYRWRLENPKHLKEVLQAHVGSAGHVRPFTVLNKTILSLDKQDDRFLLIQFGSDPNDESLLDFRPGDHLAILPRNADNLVNLVACNLTNEPFNNLPLKLEVKGAGSNTWNLSSYPNGMHYRQFLSYLVDLHRIPMDKVLAYINTREFIHPLDEEISLDPEICDLEDVLEAMRPNRLESPGLLARLDEMNKRLYSVASSPLEHGKVSILLSLTEYTKNGKQKYGLCSNYLRNLNVGETVYGYYISTNFQMRLDEDPKKPMILVSAGSGYAPFRSFIKHREVQSKCGIRTGKILILFGCRNKNVDILKDETDHLSAKKILNIERQTAFSREAGLQRKYVQDLLFENKAEVESILLKQEGTMYVCGSQKMAMGVQANLESILSSSGSGVTVNDLIQNKRYQEEFYD